MRSQTVFAVVISLAFAVSSLAQDAPAHPATDIVALRAALERLRADAAGHAAAATAAAERNLADAARLRTLAEIATAEATEGELLLVLEAAEQGGPGGDGAARQLRTVRGREIRRLPIEGAYVVVVPLQTYRSDWLDMVRAMVVKYRARVVVYERGVKDWKDDLAILEPQYACFVARPNEIGRELHTKIRQLDADPCRGAVSSWRWSRRIRRSTCRSATA